MNISSDEQKIKRITDAVLSLPVLPTITSKILELVDNPQTSAQMLSNLVSRDQVLTAKILKIANSSFYGFSGEINTVKHAVVILGYDSLKEISLSMSVFNVFKSDKKNKYFDVTEFWKHSIGVGMCARLIAEKISYPNTSEAFTAGILHDLGKVVLNQYLPYDFLKMQEMVNLDNIPVAVAEKEIFGVGHSQVGTWLATRWKLPEKLTSAIEFHHCPWVFEGEDLIPVIIFLANRLAFSAKIGSSGRKVLENIQTENQEFILAKTGLTEIDYSDIITQLKTVYEMNGSNLVSEIN